MVQPRRDTSITIPLTMAEKEDLERRAMLERRRPADFCRILLFPAPMPWEPRRPEDTIVIEDDGDPG